MAKPEQLWDLASHIDAERAQTLRGRLAGKVQEKALGTAVLLATAYPALLAAIELDPAGLPAGARGHVQWRRLETLAETAAPELRRELRIVARRERMRIAFAELLPTALGGIDVGLAARELSVLAERTIEVALADACTAVFARLGRPAQGERPGRIAVLGMGKLGGAELNAGSDVDLCCFYDSDECDVIDAEGKAGGASAHEVWSKVVQRMTATLEEITEDGFVWRVDLRLRPEGARGPLVNSLAAAERYYETFGRLWERAALLRARPVAGDRTFGEEVLAALDPFIWRKHVDPTIAETMYELVRRARREHQASDRDLKLGPGGIREAEMFVQTLQLIWGGVDARLREKPTLAAADRLRAAGCMSSREADDLASAYTFLRRAEHAVQNASGLHTHTLPSGADLDRLARALGHQSADGLLAELDRHTSRVAELFRSLLPEQASPPSGAPRWRAAIAELDRGDSAAFALALEQAGMPWAHEAARDLYELSRVPSSPVGAVTRERHRDMASALFDAIADSADPEQTARYLRRVLGRVPHPEVYTDLLAADPAALRRLCTVLGGSAFLGEVAAARPELVDLLLFEAGRPSPADAKSEVLRSLELAPHGSGRAADDQERTEALVGALRDAKTRVALQVALADLAGVIDTRGATLVLSELADASLEAAARIALEVPDGGELCGLTIVALGKLGGREIGYGSDLDVLFLYDPAAAPSDDPVAYYTRRAQRIIRFISMPHAEGKGYELDTRLRPSGNQGLLVTSLDAFARYHEVAPPSSGERAATWERLTLLRARVAAGDRAIGDKAIAIAQRAAYERPVDRQLAAADVDRLRGRMERELAREREGRYDLKLGRGGLMDIELGVQLMQLIFGGDRRVRTTDTAAAIDALGQIGALDEEQAQTFGEGYAFLRRLEQRLRIVHDDSAHLIEARAAGLPQLARRMGIAGADPAAELMAQYRRVTERVRRVYQQIIDG